MMNTYWDGNGKHEDKLSKLSALVPNIGMTSNPLMNLYLTASNIYNDVYNNSGGNIADCYYDYFVKYVLPYESEFKNVQFHFNVKPATLVKNLTNLEKLEVFMDEVILFVASKELNFETYTLYFSDRKGELSRTYKEGFSTITFGNKKDCEEGLRYREVSWGYKVV